MHTMLYPYSVSSVKQGKRGDLGQGLLARDSGPGFTFTIV